MKPDDFRWHVAARQPPGTSDTSRFATDHINNPNAINTIFNLRPRPTESERMRDGTMAQVHHILKDGADSVGVAGASLRVYVNIGMCGDYWVTLHDPVLGIARRQQPFDMDHARKNCEDWRNTEARMANAEAFLKTLKPLLLKDAPGGAAYQSASADTLRAGRRAFAEHCATCHSSKQPPAGTADPAQWFRDAVDREDFLTDNFLVRRQAVFGRADRHERRSRDGIERHAWPHLGAVLVGDVQSAEERWDVSTILYNPRIRRSRSSLEIPGAAAVSTGRHPSPASGRRRRTCTTTRSAPM